MRQSKAAGRALGNARRVALTSLGAGLAVSAGAPLASAATIADAAPLAANAIAPAADNAGMANSVPLTSAPLPDVADAVAPADSAPLSAAGAPAADPAMALANGALTTSTAALSGTATANWSHLGHFKLYPLAGTGVDPLSNIVGTNLGGIPVSTQPVSQMVADGLPVSDLPVVGALFNAVQG
jgi:hypothetical protein